MSNTIKAMFINGSPRKNWNTAKMLESAMKGAEEAGAVCELVHLYDFNLFSEEDKRHYRDEHFATDLQNAHDLGRRLVAMCQRANV